MGTYNTLHSALTCPRCGEPVETEVECHFGSTAQMSHLKIGDRYPWLPGKQRQNGGRPRRRLCPRCGKDAFLRVLVREDVIVGLEPDNRRRGHIPD